MFTIQPYQLCDETIQKATVAHLAEEWGPVYSTEGYIERIWSRTDIMFVMSDDSSFIGCVAVDRRNFFPVMSHLYVVPEKRGLGYGNRLLRFAERYAVKLSFTEIKLWCSQDMVSYYLKKGWVQEGTKDNQIIMRKTF
jgi:GNAT superfamily N-acetyltransferase